MIRQYIWKLVFRVGIFLSMLYIYFCYPAFLEIENKLHNSQLALPIFIIWIILMAEMIIQILPQSKITMGCLKQFKCNYQEVSRSYNADKLKVYIKKMNEKALVVLVVWLLFNSVFGVLYFQGVIGVKELVLLSIFYYVCDLICIIFWCPFQSLIMKNKCCVTCRIFNWGHFMMYTPMAFIASFFSITLFVTSILILIRWEYVVRKYPERFWEGTSEKLQCVNCTDKMCVVKKGHISKGKSDQTVARP